MIRHLILYSDITPEQAEAATAAAAKMGSADLLMAFRTGQPPGRLLLYDNVTVLGKKRRAKSRVIDDPILHPERVRASAIAAGQTVFNVFSAAERPDDVVAAYPGTDCLFTVALADGDAVAWFARINGGTAASIAEHCVRRQWLTSHRNLNEYGELGTAIRSFFWPVRRLPNPAWADQLVADYARTCLATVPALD